MSDTSNAFEVVSNDEEQYSVWPVGRPLPAFWHKAGFAGPYDECLDYIEKTWIDMRPRTLRQEMSNSVASDAERSGPQRATDLGRRLIGQHNVDIHLRGERSLSTLRDEIRGGTLQLAFGAEFGGLDMVLALDPPTPGWDAGNLAILSGGTVIDGVSLSFELTIDILNLNTVVRISQGIAHASK